ncbi:unnamed protein product [Parascedosporium putredinis]|uniref:NAD-dependent epimerase/dehydratase domain-containing protein n=1 Tax=Parascedosporium putredinis TaxID=1442378 RepID=A0A9P1H146_9PEZI|nr:unnamed protein product [Parascedosporium putredinis]CAI7994787.1 unnamed protein product [Parascedosporium putredinis]
MTLDYFPPPKSPNTMFLVTGVNGLIASHVADQLLAAGYRVRGTVRDISRCQWLADHFESRYGYNRFGLVQLNDFGAEGAWEVTLQGVSGSRQSRALPTSRWRTSIAPSHQSSNGSTLFVGSQKTSSVKSFSFTSSAWAAYTPNPNVTRVLTENTWNEEAVARAADPRLSAEEKGLAPFMAQGSTSGMLLRLFEGKDYEIILKILPQWFVDSRDAGRLHLAALTDPSVDRQRLFACAERYSWPQILSLMRTLYPERQFVELEDQGWDQTTVPNAKAEELLRRLGRSSWVSLQDSVRENIECYYHPS